MVNEKDIIARLPELVKALTPVPDMAALLDINESELRFLLDEPDNQVGKTFRKLLAEEAFKIRQRNIELADAGSPTAAEAVAGHLSQMLASL